MRVAVVDCGTNTFNLLIADISSIDWKVVFQNKIAVKLGAGGFDSRTIVPSRFIRGLDAIYCHRQNILNFGCEKVFVYATSAIREATNGNEFVHWVKAKFNIDIEVIDGDKEAEFIYNGVIQTIQLTNQPVLMMDIGGGSTEFIIADNCGIRWKQSFLLGVSRLNDKIVPNQKIEYGDLNFLMDFISKELNPLIVQLKIHEPKWIVGSSGSFDTLLDMYLYSTNKTRDETSLSQEIEIKSFHAIHNWLIGSSLDDRLKHPAIPAIRAEYMPIASYLVNYVLAQLNFEKFYQSNYGLKEGAMQLSCKQLSLIESFE